MAKNIRFNLEIAKSVNLKKNDLKVLKGKITPSAKAGVEYVWSKIQALDSALYTSMSKTHASATAELGQLPSNIKNSITSSNNNFMCCWHYDIPFIVLGDTVISFDRSNNAEQKPMAKLFGEAVAAYIGGSNHSVLANRVKSKIKQNKTRGKGSIALASVDSKIASLVSTY
jgi:hypothetical protein